MPRSAPEAQALLAERPVGWEFLYFAARLLAERELVSGKYHDHQLRFALPTGERVDEFGAYTYVRDVPEELSRLMQALEPLMANDVTAKIFGRTDGGGDPRYIEHIATRWNAIYMGLMDWAASVRGMGRPAEWDEVFEATARMADQPIEDYRAYVSDLVISFDRIPAAIESGEPLELNLFLTPSIGDEVIEARGSALARLQANHVAAAVEGSGADATYEADDTAFDEEDGPEDDEDRTEEQLPDDLSKLCDRVSRLTYPEAYALARAYERWPETPTGRARKAFDRVVQDLGLADQEDEWLGAAGRACQVAETSEEWHPEHGESWRWATQAVLDAARSLMTRPYLSPDDRDALIRPWQELVAGELPVEAMRTKSDHPSSATPLGYQVDLPWLDDAVAPDEGFEAGMVLSRETYIVAYAAIRNPDGSGRITFRGTGMYDDWFQSISVQDDWELDNELELLARRFKLRGPQISRSVRYFDDADAFAAALDSLSDDDNPFLQ